MRFLGCTIALLAMSVAAVAAEPVKVSVSASDEMLSAVAAKLVKDAGVNVIVDPKADTKISLSLSEAELPQILDSLAKVTKLTWKKVQFAKPAESKVTLDQIKSSILALSTMPLVAASVQDGSGKGAAMFARDLTTVPDSVGVKLPEGYAWSTVYVIYNPEQLVEQTAAKPAAEKSQKPTNSNNKRLEQLANMSSEDRKREFANEVTDLMTLAPEARRQVLQDQFSAIRDMDPKVRDQYIRDMGSVMRGLMPRGNNNNRNNNRTNNNTNRNQRPIVIPAR